MLLAEHFEDVLLREGEGWDLWIWESKRRSANGTIVTWKVNALNQQHILERIK